MAMYNTNYRTPGPLGRHGRTPKNVRLTHEPYWRFDGLATNGVDERPQAFPNITRAALLASLQERLEDPSRISQRGTSLCGPSCLMYLTATYRPAVYYQFVLNLYEYGTANLGPLRITPGEDCKNYDPGTRMAAADWVSLASIRDSENDVFDYDDIDDQVAGITMPEDLAGWFEAVGFGSVQNETNLIVTKGAGNWNEAVALSQSGYQVCILIKAHGIDNLSIGFTARLFPNHWVILTSVESNSSEDLRFTVYSWGDGQHRVPWHTGVLTLDDWLGYYYGYVACRV